MAPGLLGHAKDDPSAYSARIREIRRKYSGIHVTLEKARKLREGSSQSGSRGLSRGYGTVAGRGMRAGAEVDVGQGRRLIDTAMKIRQPVTVPRGFIAGGIAIKIDHGDAAARRRIDCFSVVHPLRIKQGVVIIDKP